MRIANRHNRLNAAKKQSLGMISGSFRQRHTRWCLLSVLLLATALSAQVPSAQLGGVVWEDTNGDGIYQSGEPAIHGATVNLLDAGGNAVQDLNGNAATQTNANGEYSFDVLPGDYLLQFPTPDGYLTSPQDQGDDEQLDSDYDPAGNNKTALVTVGNADINNDIDAAFKPRLATYLYKLSEESKQQLSRIRLDRDLDQQQIIANKIIYGGAVPGGQLISGFTVGKPIGANTEAMAYDANTKTTYIISNKLSSAVLLKLDLATGVAYSIGVARTAANKKVKAISALAFNQQTNELYGITTAKGNHLLRISTTDAKVVVYAQLITPQKKAGTLESTAFDHTVDPPVLYAISKQTPGQIYTIDLNTGLGTSVGKLPMSVESFDIAPASGTMYVVSGGYWGNIYSVDRVTHAVQLVSNCSLLDAEGIAVVEGVEEQALAKHHDLAELEGAEEMEAVAVPREFVLQQNYPNPFNPITMISFTLPEAGKVTVNIYNGNGQLVRTLVDREMPAGQQTLRWNSRDQLGKTVAAGVYLYRMVVTNNTGEAVFTETKRMTLLK